MGPREQSIARKLQIELQPDHLEVINESGQHSVPVGSESHFKVVVVSSLFEGMNRVRRSQKIYAVLEEELKQGLHALSQYTYTPSEWRGRVPDSPGCAGGSGS